MNKSTIVAALCCVSLTACQTTLQGSPRIIDSGGVAGAAAVAGSQNSGNGNGAGRTARFKTNFRTDVEAAATDPVKVGQMLRSGFLLVRTNCDDFFTDMSVLQRDSQIARDMVAPVLTILTGLVALKGFSGSQSDEYLDIATLGSTAALAGIDTVDKHFLFSSENIHEVRELTFKALAAHQEGVENLGGLNFEDGLMQLIDHQVICTPASILDLTKRAIRAGDVAPNPASVDPAIEEALDDLGQALGLAGAVTLDQAGALWWLYRGGVAGDAVPLEVVAALSGLGDKSPVRYDETSKKTSLTQEGSNQRDEIIDILNGFPSETKRSFAEAIQNAIEARPKPATGAIKVLQSLQIVPVQPFRVAPGAGASRKVGLEVN